MCVCRACVRTCVRECLRACQSRLGSKSRARLDPDPSDRGRECDRNQHRARWCRGIDRVAFECHFGLRLVLFASVKNPLQVKGNVLETSLNREKRILCVAPRSDFSKGCPQSIRLITPPALWRFEVELTFMRAAAHVWAPTRNVPSKVSQITNDMENYMEYHVMGSVSQVRMKPAFSQAHIENTSQKDSHKSADKATQVLITYKYRSKAIQTEVNLVNQMTSPLKPFNQSVSTSPFKIKSCITAKPSTSMIQKYSRKLFTIEEESDSDISFAPSSTHRESSPSTISQQMKSTSDCSELIEEDKKQEASKILEYTLLK
ncbi:hypothetical protein EVAR_17372_1 [Eumeta japonica]|uniref:Uncharacterized protein n=1 Tax=Eumeta variegata TaxID=151549 RepID=A0A4C1WG31_EUMVA|nr:hypothetical protein EVAR_17372_1 [Eumeta japonica]